MAFSRRITLRLAAFSLFKRELNNFAIRKACKLGSGVGKRRICYFFFFPFTWVYSRIWIKVSESLALISKFKETAGIK